MIFAHAQAEERAKTHEEAVCVYTVVSCAGLAEENAERVYFPEASLNCQLVPRTHGER